MNAFRIGIVILLMLVVASRTLPAQSADNYVKLDPAKYVKDIEGKKSGLFTIKNNNGMEASMTNYGGRLVQVVVPDKNGTMGDVALGYGSVDDIMKGLPYIGVLVGRYANRIEDGKFAIGGVQYQATNPEGHALHGGAKNSRVQVFDAVQLAPNAVQFSYIFKDGEEGFPGTVPFRAIYELTDDNELNIRYDAVAVDKDTIVNFTGHAFFNLSGDPSTDTLDHLLQIEADTFTPVKPNLIPTGELRMVNNTPMDFRTAKPIGQDIGKDDEQLKLGGGYDHNFVIRGWQKGRLVKHATVVDPKSGRKMEIFSTEPGLQFFSGNSLKGQEPFGKGNTQYNFRTGFALEPQHFPNSPNQPEFPPVVLRKGEWYSGIITYKFSVEK